jgi:hypothetical protein
MLNQFNLCIIDTGLTNRAMLAAIVDLRRLAWDASDLAAYCNSGAVLTDGLEYDSVHFMVWHGSRLVSVARLSLLNPTMLLENSIRRLLDMSDSPALLSRLATRPEYRNLGLAGFLTEQRLTYLTKQGIDGDVFTYMRASAATHYTNAFGFELLEQSDVPYPNSCLMRRRVGPVTDAHSPL